MRSARSLLLAALSLLSALLLIWGCGQPSESVFPLPAGELAAEDPPTPNASTAVAWAEGSVARLPRQTAAQRQTPMNLSPGD